MNNGNQASKTAKNLRVHEIKLIHIARRDLNMSEDAYRDVMQAVTGKRSSSDLDWTQRQRFLEHLKKLGWKPKAPTAGANALQTRSQPKLQVPGLATTGNDQESKIAMLWAELHAKGQVRNPSDQALQAYVERQTGMSHTRFCNPYQLSTVIESLKRWLSRPAPPRGAHG